MPMAGVRRTSSGGKIVRMSLAEMRAWGTLDARKKRSPKGA